MYMIVVMVHDYGTMITSVAVVVTIINISIMRMIILIRIIIYPFIIITRFSIIVIIVYSSSLSSS